MSRIDTVLAWVPAVSLSLRKRLLAVLTEAFAEQSRADQASASKPKPAAPKAPATSGAAIREGARASEGGESGALASEREAYALADAAFVASVLDAGTILASEGRRIAAVEGMALAEAQDAALARYPKTRLKYAESR